MEDERQKKSRGVISNIVAEEENKGKKVTHSLGGKYKASYVDLGKIYDKIVEMFKDEEGTELTDRRKEGIMDMVQNLVQRLKGFSFDETENHWEIHFVTKDDYSYYTYEFSIYKEKLKN